MRFTLGDEELRAAVVTGARILDHEGCVGSLGHLSARLPGRQDLFLITPRKGPGTSTEADLLVMDMDARVVEGNGEPNSEVFIHAEIFRARPDVGSIAHLHPPATIILGITGEPFRVVHNSGVSFYDGVPVYEDLGFIRDAVQGRRLATVVGDHRGCLMRGHGSVVVGGSVVETVIRSLDMEYNASLQVAAMQTGRPTWEFPTEVARTLDGKANPVRLWEHYRRRAGLA